MDDIRLKFEAWLDEELQKKNTTLMSNEMFNFIVEYLNGEREVIPRKVEKRVKRKQYRVLSYSALNLHNTPFQHIARHYEIALEKGPGHHEGGTVIELPYGFCHLT